MPAADENAPAEAAVPCSLRELVRYFLVLGAGVVGFLIVRTR